MELPRSAAANERNQLDVMFHFENVAIKAFSGNNLIFMCLNNTISENKELGQCFPG